MPASRALVAFAGACGQRAAGLWTPAEDPRIAALLRDTLELIWRCAEADTPAPAQAEAPLLAEVDEDADFGEFHLAREDAIITVAWAAATAAALGDDETVRTRAASAARAEIRILDAAADALITRELAWQRDDAADLAIAVPFATVRSRAAVAATLLRSGVTTGDCSAQPPALDEPFLF
ncbi:hypothetical protein BJ973_003864 [Actinoplanes tereljensis]|uniref:Uncharacterized protein n=1 Tax=Paractinoplanes tereljensis TaxID=571912 RepID=A0A919NX69_9ACTN|nr:hypothetical protein [Actinoplanes tereljensis]GIF25586.1 hypothetical protein Ate02nite_83160 [Actinoplanes tereljensis]